MSPWNVCETADAMDIERSLGLEMTAHAAAVNMQQNS
jgi:hypothetical protein